jgi:1,2-phenylacetyl-CoA epoxidase PaaB subunit
VGLIVKEKLSAVRHVPRGSILVPKREFALIVRQESITTRQGKLIVWHVRTHTALSTRLIRARQVALPVLDQEKKKI